MSISLSLFDVFTYMVPGSLYLSLILYLTDRLGWVDISHLKSTPSLILVGGILVASYVLGHVAEPLAGALDRRLRNWKAIYNRDSRAEFIRRTPNAAHRAYVQADLMLLLAAAEANEKDAALSGRILKLLKSATGFLVSMTREAHTGASRRPHGSS